MTCARRPTLFWGFDMDTVKFALVGILCAVLTVIVKQYRPELAIFVQAGGIIVLAFFSAEYLKIIMDEADVLFGDTDIIDGGSLKLLIKLLAVAIITKLGSDICKDSGNSALAAVVELTGKAVMLAMCLSMIELLASVTKSMVLN